ncbi:MAG: DegT/DnrJ/EryC1/StrS family aminotransferase [Gammaproteobacteria bacterium]|nr:DegT/DnrJ/EryC1/StrS family aminotransferase [Gammaproteobacteria bacterium]
MPTRLLTRSVPFFNYRGAFAGQEEEFVRIFRDVLRRGAFIMQRDLEQFEANLASYLGVKHAIGLANCTDALVIALRAAGIGPGDEVLFPSHTMVASPSSIFFVGATPVPVDCGPDHLIDPDSVRRALTSRTKAIMPVQLNGRTADMDAIGTLAREHGLVIVEDSAQGLGSKFKGRFAGTFGVAGTFSFYPAKILGCFGDGGALVTDDDEIARKTLLYRDHGRNAQTGDVEMWGLNSRLDNLHAAILDFQFRDYQAIIDRRRALARLYQDLLGDVPELVLPPAPDSNPDHYDTFQNYEIEAERRDDLRQFLKERGIGTLVQWGGKAVHQFHALGFTQRLPNTERLFTRCLMLPLNLTLADDDMRYVAGGVREFYGRG